MNGVIRISYHSPLDAENTVSSKDKITKNIERTNEYLMMILPRSIL